MQARIRKHEVKYRSTVHADLLKSVILGKIACYFIIQAIFALYRLLIYHTAAIEL